MRIHVYTILKNEEKMLPFFLRHYTKFAERIFVFDDQSTDSTQDLLKACEKVTVAQVTKSGIDDRYFREVYSEEYKKRRGECEWVICVDVDEFVFHERLQQRLEEYLKEGVKIIKCAGWSMFADAFPSGEGQVYDEVKTGIFDVWQCKPIVFSPSIDIRFDLGRHGSRNTERTSLDCDLKLLHYRFFGEDYCAERHRRNANALSEGNRREKLGKHNLEGSKYYHSLWWYTQHRKEAVELPFLNPPRR